MAKGEIPNPVSKKLLQDYEEMQKAQYAKDLKLLNYFKSTKDPIKAE
jgi:hypothetical protein